MLSSRYGRLTVSTVYLPKNIVPITRLSKRGEQPVKMTQDHRATAAHPAGQKAKPLTANWDLVV